MANTAKSSLLTDNMRIERGGGAIKRKHWLKGRWDYVQHKNRTGNIRRYKHW
jgi:hypothetical protein